MKKILGIALCIGALSGLSANSLTSETVNGVSSVEVISDATNIISVYGGIGYKNFKELDEKSAFIELAVLKFEDFGSSEIVLNYAKVNISEYNIDVAVGSEFTPFDEGNPFSFFVNQGWLAHDVHHYSSWEDPNDPNRKIEKNEIISQSSPYISVGGGLVNDWNDVYFILGGEYKYSLDHSDFTNGYNLSAGVAYNGVSLELKNESLNFNGEDTQNDTSLMLRFAYVF